MLLLPLFIYLHCLLLLFVNVGTKFESDLFLFPFILTLDNSPSRNVGVLDVAEMSVSVSFKVLGVATLSVAWVDVKVSNLIAFSPSSKICKTL